MTKHVVHDQLLKLAEWRLESEAGTEKTAFVPATAGGGGGDPSAGGMPPGGDPSGGMPPGGMPPGGDPSGGMPPGMDPSAMGGGMPPGMDPSAMGGDPSGGAGGGMPSDPTGGGPDIQAMIQQAVQQAMSQPGMGGGGGGMPGQGGVGPDGKPKKVPIDPAFIYMELARVRKLLTHLLTKTGIGLPDDIMDDGTVANQLQGVAPQSAPIDSSNAAGQDNAAGAGGPPPLPGIGGSGPLSPIQAPGAAGGGEKQSAASAFMGREIDILGRPINSGVFANMNQRLDSLAALARSLNRNRG